MDMNAAYQEVGTYRAAAAICGTSDKTVKRAVAKARAAEAIPGTEVVVHNYDDVATIIAKRVERTDGRISAKRLLPIVQGRRLRGLGPQPAASGGRGQGEVAGGPSPGPSARGVGAGRRARRLRLGPDRPALRVLRRIGLEPVPLRLLRRQPWGNSTMAALADHGDDRGGAQDPPHRSHGLPEGRRSRRARGPDTGLRALRHPLRHPTGLLLRGGPRVQGPGREPGRLREVRPHDPRRAQPRRSGGSQCQGEGVVRRSEHPGAFGDRGGPGRTPRDRAPLARPPAPAAGPDRKGGAAQGGPLELCSLRLGPLLGADGPHRAHRGASSGRWSGDGRVLGRDHRRAQTRRTW